MNKLPVLFLIVMFLSSCNEGVVTFNGGDSKVRFINEVSRSQNVDILLDKSAIISNADFNKPTSYVTLTAGITQILEMRDNKDTNSFTRTLARQGYVFAIDAHYTIVARGFDRTGYLKPILDTLTSPFNDSTAIRLVNTSEQLLSGNISINGKKMFNRSLESADYTKYLVPSAYGSVSINALDADNKDSVVTTITATLQQKEVYYIIIYDKPNNGGIGLSVFSTRESL